MQRLSFPCIQIRTDEDGALVNNTEFCKMMYTSLGMGVESSGGYASSINGAAETPSQTCKRTIRAQLIGSSISNIFHCFAGGYSPWIYHNVIHRIMGEIPLLKLWGKYVPMKYLHPFGTRVKV